jgi:hypothetical protein
MAAMTQNNAELMTVRQLSIRLEDATSAERLVALEELQVRQHVSVFWLPCWVLCAIVWFPVCCVLSTEYFLLGVGC